jgi:hypothetical protein
MKPIQFDRAFHAEIDGISFIAKRLIHVEKNAIL